jgi:hypothetical protein
MNPATASQLDFFSTLFLTLLTKEEAACYLDDCSTRHVLDLIDEGKLRGVDIASTWQPRTKAGELQHHREVRVYRYSAEWLVKHPTTTLPRVTFDEIVKFHLRETLLRREVAHLLNCTEQHVSNLALPGPRHQGDARHRVYRAELISFLTRREIAA